MLYVQCSQSRNECIQRPPRVQSSHLWYEALHKGFMGTINDSKITERQFPLKTAPPKKSVIISAHRNEKCFLTFHHKEWLHARAPATMVHSQIIY